MTNHPNPKESRNPKWEGAKQSNHAVVREPSLAIRHSFVIWLSSFVILSVLPAAAQWTTQTINLTEGWNGVFFHVAPPTNTLTQLITAEPNIQEIWLWRPTVTSQQYVESPEQPTTGGSRWMSWARTNVAGSDLKTLIGNAAYLVRMAGTASESWPLKGKPVPPRYQWTQSGLNFIGFQTRPTAPTFSQFFTGIQIGTELGVQAYGYNGELTPMEVIAPATRLLKRGEAYWFRAGSYNRYFGPFGLLLSDASGINFGTTVGRQRVVVRNVTDQDISVSVQLNVSETPPAGEVAITGVPPLIVRGELNTADLTYSATNFLSQPSQMMTWNLKKKNTPGSAVEIILGINRNAMSGSVGSLYAGILRFTDSLNLTQVDVPVSAGKESLKGLWVGDAIVTEVRHNLLQKPIAAGGGN